MDDMKNFRLWGEGFRYYEQVRAMVDRNDLDLWA